jgi:hypothetical protein
LEIGLNRTGALSFTLRAGHLSGIGLSGFGGHVADIILSGRLWIADFRGSLVLETKKGGAR